MSYQDQRSDEHPEAVRSDPVPVQRTAPDDEHDADRTADAVDGGYDETERGHFEGNVVDDGYHDSTTPEPGYHDSTTPEAGYHDNVVTGADADRDGDGVVDSAEARDDADRDGDGVADSAEAPAADRDGDGVVDEAEARDDVDRNDNGIVDSTEGRDDTDVYHEAEDERSGYDDPVLASPVDTDAERSGVDHAELDRDRADDDRAFGGPTFPDSAMTPVAFGAATAGGAAAAAAMAANRTDTRTDAEAVDSQADRADSDRVDADRADSDRVDADRDGVDDRVEDDRFGDREERFGDVADRVADEPDDAEALDERADDEPTELMPGQVDVEPVTALVAVEAAQGFRDRWREVQLRFVDDPRGAAGEAQSLAEEAADALVAALDSMRNDLGGWQATEGTDTEHLRVVVRRYRDFLDRMLQS
ncbi:hypothetical protein O7635_00990 [Asanoa sp. WMMD1127]|uniref:hypothetical protein n=1 Tax=Asanoa sp. WMMD1127 TaxID=3016107 RepID=UPI00241677FC|nr:hypothetical protein [Asanoa sp. WMMD1127]MDG4820427.1 hypothetical protein [Asanoa sp. WMMD1127]